MLRRNIHKQDMWWRNAGWKLDNPHCMRGRNQMLSSASRAIAREPLILYCCSKVLIHYIIVSNGLWTYHWFTIKVSYCCADPRSWKDCHLSKMDFRLLNFARLYQGWAKNPSLLFCIRGFDRQLVLEKKHRPWWTRMQGCNRARRPNLRIIK